MKMVFLIALLILTFGEISLTNSEPLLASRENPNIEFRHNVPRVPLGIRGDTFEQKLDHFNGSDSRTWKQLYYYNDDYNYYGDLVYLWLWDIGPAYRDLLQTGYWHKHAKDNNALLLMLEHRFYGTSQPFQNISTENLKYLNVSQALEDVVEFINVVKKGYRIQSKAKWIIFGGFYGGSLAAWMRVKYPNLVFGAVASSAPVVAKLDYPNYLDAVNGTLASYKQQCKTDIALANQKLDELLETKRGRTDIGNIFRLCSPLEDNKLDWSHFVTTMKTYISYNVEFDRWGKNVKQVCDKMLENSDKEEPINRYANLMNMLLKKFENSCLPTKFNEYVSSLQVENATSAMAADRVYLYQMCTQFGWFQISRKNSHTFSKYINREYFANLCSKVFSSSFSRKFTGQGVKKTNKLFGGSNIDTSRLIIVHGTADPWKTAGITSMKKKKHLHVVIVEGGSQCAEIGNVRKEDPPAKKNAQNKIMEKIDSWIKPPPPPRLAP